MNQIIKAFIALFASYHICFAAEGAQKRADIIVDEDLYADSEVLQAIQKYADIVEKNFDVKIRIYSFPAALVAGINSRTERNSTAQELKAKLIESWKDETNGQLMGAILMGNLPFAEMEYFSRKDGYPTFPEGDPVTRYQRWVVDMYYMDLDGIWEDRLIGTGCSDEKPCTGLDYGSNGLLDTEYKKDGTLGTDEFDIWISRVNPYGEAEIGVTTPWNMTQVKEYMLRWLDKAYKQQVKATPRAENALFTYSSKHNIHSNDPSGASHINGYSEMYNRTDILYTNKKEPYLQAIMKEEYDWLSFLGHGSRTSISNGTSINDFNTPVTVGPRVFHFASCLTLRNVTLDGLDYIPTIGYSHLFRTLGGGTSVIGATKTTGGYQDDEALFGYLKSDYLGDAFRKWANHRALVYDQSKYPQEVYDWFYSMTLLGDPFVRMETDLVNVEKDEAPEEIALHATYSITFNDSAECLSGYTDSDEGCNILSEIEFEKNPSVNIKNGSHVGNIYSKDGVFLGGFTDVKKVNVYNFSSLAYSYITDSASYNLFSYFNRERWNDSIVLHDELFSFDVKKCSDVVVSDKYTLASGDCFNSLTVKDGGTVVFPRGEFFIGDLILLDESKYNYAEPGAGSIIHVNGKFIWKGTIEYMTEENHPLLAQGVKLYVHSNQEISFNNDWHGSVYAPESNLYFGDSLSEDHKVYGNFLGKVIEVNKGLTVVYTKFDPVGGIPEKEKIPISIVNPIGHSSLNDLNYNVRFHDIKGRVYSKSKTHYNKILKTKK